MNMRIPITIIKLFFLVSLQSHRSGPVFICTIIISVHDFWPQMLIDTFFKRMQGMQKSSARLNSCGVTVKPSAVWKSGKFQMKWGVQSSLSLFKLQLNILRIAAASSVRQQLGLFIDDFMRQSSKPDDDTDTKRSLLSGLILFSTEPDAVFLGREVFLFFFFHAHKHTDENSKRL